jgi:hypothetical protein
MSRVIDLTGQRFGRLVVLKRAENNRRGQAMWLCRCDCGKEKIISSSPLRSGVTQSCGCYHNERSKEIHTKHGMCGTRIHDIWVAMRQRCSNHNNPSYRHYIENNIHVCEEWHNFNAFNEWSMANGYQENLTLDRIDNTKGYCPQNCRWATRTVQNNNRRNNRRITYNGETLTLSQWCDRTGLSESLLFDRIVKLGWSAEKALTTKKKGS